MTTNASQDKQIDSPHSIFQTERADKEQKANNKTKHNINNNNNILECLKYPNLKPMYSFGKIVKM